MLDVLRREIINKGVDNVILWLSSDNISEDTKTKLSNSNIFIGGYLNLSLLYLLS
ncbi:MAG: hypothetical protein GX682_02250 [Clostridiaceae bacterium]|nr:hypothetical protein [Clostridiaceae bacterium]